MKVSVCLAAMLCCGMLIGAEVLKVGDAAPDVSAIDEAGNAVKLASFKGKNGVVVFFYPKADTPGCTKESCGFRDESAAYTAKGYVVFGASRDTPEAQKAFKEKFKLNYSLLSDPKGEMATAFGFKPGARSTIVIDKDGKVEKVIEKAGTETHAKELLGDLK